MCTRHAWIVVLALVVSCNARATTAEVLGAEDQARQFLTVLHVRPKWDVPSYKPLLKARPADVMPFISPDGVAVWNAMDSPNPEKTYKTKTIQSQLVERSGTFYSRLSHLGQTASIPYPQYSELRFKHEGPDKLVVGVGDGSYVLTFVKRGERYVLTRIKYAVEERE